MNNCSIYYFPDADDGIFDCLLVSLVTTQENDGKASLVIIGDFSINQILAEIVSPANCHGLIARDFSSESRCFQIICNSTHRFVRLGTHLYRLSWC